MAFPYSMIEPIRDQLHAGLQSDTIEYDERWEKLLLDGLKDTSLTLNSTLARVDVTLRDIREMQAGDVFPLELPETVSATIEGVPVFNAKYGMSRGNHALKINKIMNPELSQPNN